MPQKKKSKTKKQMKKSINNLWNTLQAEKAKHAKASGLVSRMKINLHVLDNVNNGMRNHISDLENTLESMKNRENHASEVMAQLVSNLT